jgi:hypothetical protein
VTDFLFFQVEKTPTARDIVMDTHPNRNRNTLKEMRERETERV